MILDAVWPLIDGYSHLLRWESCWVWVGNTLFPLATLAKYLDLSVLICTVSSWVPT